MATIAVACLAGGGCGGVKHICTARTDAELCAAFSFDCGPANVVDRCGVAREITSCGACKAPMACGGAGHANKCAACTHPVVTSDCTEGWCTIPAGCFTMGSPTTEKCREPKELLGKETQHKVSLTRKFQIMQTELDAYEFEKVMNYNPSEDSPKCGSGCPVDHLTWHEAAAYCNAVSKLQSLTQCYTCTGAKSAVVCKSAAGNEGNKIYACQGFRLPTEAEWEYAYRAGSTTAFYNGPITSCDSDANAAAIAWYTKNSGSKLHPSKNRAPNKWGLYDMAGNLWEWCHDNFAKDLGSAHQTDPAGVTSATFKVLRGGDYQYPGPTFVRAAARRSDPATQASTIGMRCVRTLPK